MEILSNVTTMNDAERCPSCGSGKLVLQGRSLEGTFVRSLVCMACKHSWPIELP